MGIGRLAHIFGRVEDPTTTLGGITKSSCASNCARKPMGERSNIFRMLYCMDKGGHQ